MTNHETPVLNQIAFGVGEGWVMFWPVWLMAAILAVVLFGRKRRVAGAGLAVLAATPLSVLALFLGLLTLGVDVGPRDGLAARALDAATWVYVGTTLLCALGSAATLGLFVVSAFDRRSIHA